MNASKIISLCQLAIRAGRIAKGDGLLGSIQKEQAKLVIISSVIGANRKKKITDKCKTYNVPLMELDAADFEKIHAGITSALAICDEGFAEKLKEYFM